MIDSQTSDNFSLPVDLAYPGYIFAGWYLDADFLTPFNFTSDYQFTQNTILYAKFIEKPPMTVFHETIFDSFKVLFECEPMLYILALTGLICIIGIGRVFIRTRF